ncbi:MAG TPA: acetate uptake transporter [Pseudonocardia sp.]|nr:acetate uptake transporter [Pseudonocardia sp.]
MSATISDRNVSEPVDARAEPPGDQIADPGPLGLAGFAMATFVLSCVNAGLASKSIEPVVLPLALCYGGLVQLLAGMWEFRKANTFGALAFSSYGAFWLSFAAYVKFVAPGLGSSANSATGVFLLAWTIFTAYMTVAAVRTTAAVLAVFVALTVTFALLTIATFSGVAVIGTIGGWVGLITAVLAWYASFAGVTNATFRRTVIPVRPLTGH